MPGVTESTGCTVGQARQLVDRCACECYERRGAMYLCQTCWADSMRGHMNGICLNYGVESRVLSVIGCSATVFSSQLFGLLRDGLELGDICLRDKQVL